MYTLLCKKILQQSMVIKKEFKKSMKNEKVSNLYFDKKIEIMKETEIKIEVLIGKNIGKGKLFWKAKGYFW